MPFDAHPELIEDVGDHPLCCCSCLTIKSRLNDDYVCEDCAPVEDDEDNEAPSLEYLMRWERTS